MKSLSRRSNPAIHIVVENEAWRKKTRALLLMRRSARLALTAAGAKSGAKGLTIMLADDAYLKNLNAAFRRRRKTTNVLSFPSADPAYLGDIAIAFGVVAREARAQAKSFSAHAAHLAAHGVLHLLGFDHEKKAEAKRMEALERRILAKLGIADPYAARGSSA